MMALPRRWKMIHIGEVFNSEKYGYLSHALNIVQVCFALTSHPPLPCILQVLFSKSRCVSV